MTRNYKEIAGIMSDQLPATYQARAAATKAAATTQAAAA